MSKTIYNYDYDSIIKALNAGEDPADIANGFADTLNTILKEREKNRVEEEKRKLHIEKIDYIDTVYGEILAYLHKYHNDFYVKYLDELSKFDSEEWVDIIDKSIDATMDLTEYLNNTNLEDLLKRFF